MPGSPPNRQKEEALRHMSKGWLPANAPLLRSIQHKLDEGEYIEDREALIEDIKADPALFVYCSRSINHIAGSGASGVDPFAELRRLEPQQLRKLFNVSDREISPHSFKEMNAKQAACLQYSLLSSHTAEALAPRAEVASDLAFAGAALRQLGSNLIAWNYPRIYTQAVTFHRKNNTSLELELKKLLGITTSEVNARLTGEWNIHPEIRHLAVPDATTQIGGSPLEPESAWPPGGRLNLQELCRLSELFAQLKDPLNYPEAQDKWQAREEFIRSAVGLELFAGVERKVEGLIEGMAEASPAILTLPLAENYLERREADNRGQELMADNSYLQQCPPELKRRFLDVYAQIDQARLSVNALNTLLESVVPAMGFKRGCLFLLSRKDLSLQPAMRIGDYPLTAYRPFVQDQGSEIAASLQSRIPFSRDSVGVDGTVTGNISGALNHPNHPGVLYLEFNRSGEMNALQAILYFNVVRRTLNDCIGEQG